MDSSLRNAYSNAYTLNKFKLVLYFNALLMEPLHSTIIYQIYSNNQTSYNLEFNLAYFRVFKSLSHLLVGH